MSDTIRVPVVAIDRIEQHPVAEHMTINYFEDDGNAYQTVSSKLEDGSPRYNIGDLAVFIPHDAVVPEYYLTQIGYEFKGGRVKAGNFKTVRSMGILTPVEDAQSGTCEKWDGAFVRNGDEIWCVDIGNDVAAFLGITKFKAKK
jgi:hypothetical protein